MIALAVLFAAAIGVLYFRQHDLVYHPRPYGAELAESLPPDVIELHYRTIAGNQFAFYVPRGPSEVIPQRLWVVFPGNGSLALEWLGFVERDANPKDAFLLIDYPGYGKSEGYASVAANRTAADGALDALKEKLGANGRDIDGRLNVIGHSFGTAPALEFATRHNVQRIVLVAAFTSLREAGASRFGLLSHLLIENYDNRARLQELATRANPPRVAIFHGTSDDVIPVKMGRDLAAAHPQFVQFFPLDGADHLSPLFKHAAEILAWMNK